MARAKVLKKMQASTYFQDFFALCEVGNFEYHVGYEMIPLHMHFLHKMSFDFALPLLVINTVRSIIIF